MPVDNFNGNTFVAFIDISGFKKMMEESEKALKTLRLFYQVGYDILYNKSNVEGFFISDCAVLFLREPVHKNALNDLFSVIKEINVKMLYNNYLLTTSVAYGLFTYENKIVYTGIEKQQIFGNAYLNAYLDNNRKPKLKPGYCRVVIENLPDKISDTLLQNCQHICNEKNKKKHIYYYWHLSSKEQIKQFEKVFNSIPKNDYESKKQLLRSFLDNINSI